MTRRGRQPLPKGDGVVSGGRLRKNRAFQVRFPRRHDVLPAMTPSLDHPDDSTHEGRRAARRPSWWQTLKEADARRASLPGEHVVVAGLGLLMLLAAGRSRSTGGRLLKAAVGGALLGRAASGSGGVTHLAETALQLADRYAPRR